MIGPALPPLHRWLAPVLILAGAALLLLLSRCAQTSVSALDGGGEVITTTISLTHTSTSTAALHDDFP